MAQLTVTTSVYVDDLDGSTPSSPSLSHVASVQDYLEFTRDVSSSETPVFTGTWSFAVVVNVGDNPLIVQVAVGGSDYQTFVVPVDGHAVLPSSFLSLAGVQALGSAMSVYTASGSSRALFAIGINNT